MRTLSLTLLIALIMVRCGDDLGAVSGIEGQINFSGSMPDSIKAVALVVLETEAINDLDNIGDYLLGYSDPLTSTGPYFIQLQPGTYMAVLVGLLVDPGIFAVRVDDYVAEGDLPVVQLSSGAFAFPVKEEVVTYEDWTVAF